MATGWEVYVDLSCPFAPKHSQLRTLLQYLHASNGKAQLLDRWVTLTSSYCTPDEIPAIGLKPETTAKRSVVTEEVTENGHVTAKLERVETVTSAAINSATPFCMTFGSQQSSNAPADVILAHIYIRSQGVLPKDVHDDVSAAINQWIGGLELNPKPILQVFVTQYSTSSTNPPPAAAVH